MDAAWAGLVRNLRAPGGGVISDEDAFREGSHLHSPHSEIACDKYNIQFSRRSLVCV